LGSLRHAWERICSFENLLSAYDRARKGKRDRLAVQRFELERERNLFALQASLLDGSYGPGPHRMCGAVLLTTGLFLIPSSEPDQASTIPPVRVGAGSMTGTWRF
jgi:hypothetical protein